jgi:hypothetical protein
MNISVKENSFVNTVTVPRATPKVLGPSFGDVMSTAARGLFRAAEAGLSVLPGAPIVATAIRGDGGNMSVGASMGQSSPFGLGSKTGMQQAEGPVSGSSAGTGAPGGIESSMQSAQEMNLYFLQIQEAVNAQNRNFTTLSNVLKAEHETVKTAIGNIR